MRRGPDGTLRSIFTDGSPISPQAREAIRGQNIWILWSEGNEAFWGWLQERNYGITDFLILIDSRKRERRFHEAGLINQPGMRARTDRTILGLYLDQADGDHVTLRQPDNDIDAGTNARASRPERGTATATPIFKPYDSRAYEETLRQLATDGVDPEVYGYPTGIVGLRLFPNPDFFADTPAAARARAYWQERVESRSNDRDNNYYANPAVASDPDLVRPFRISMTCAFCHIGPHPLNPPADPEKPEWANLSSTIGAQYWTGSRAFSNLKDQKSNLKDRKSFLFQLVQSWQPGTLDTSLVSTDQINNPNTMNAIFGIPARLARAQHNPPEAQSASNLLIPAVEDTEPFANPRHTPRVLLDGSDSIGIAGALARVYLNIGAYYEQWIRLHNPLIGFRPQRPFELATIEDKSAYWRATQQQRISDLVAFFTYVNKAGETVTAPMKLAGAPGGKEAIAREAADAVKGRTVFVENCAICHSSKQPEGFALTFSRNWAGAEPPDPGEPARFVLPMDFAEWEAFKRSDAYDEYRKRIVALAGTALAESDPFLENNYLSTDIRVPVTLVGTNSSRAVATNAMRGQIWDNFSSDTYKNLPAVGAVHFYNPYSGVPTDEWGNNDVYFPPRGGPGYYRPASLISIWATAPFLHNNALGRYTHDPSVQGRLAAFDDAIDKLLWKAKRFPSATDPPGDLRFREKAFAGRDPGFIYRTTDPSSIDIPPKFIRILLVGVMGERWTSFLTRYLWLGLGAIAIIFIVFGRQQDAGFVLLLFAVLVGALLRVTRVDAVYPVLWWAPAIALAVALALWLAPRRKAVAQLFFAVFAAFFFVVAALASDWADGRRGALDIAIPKGTPVNLLMSLNPQAPTRDLVDALSGLTRGLLRVHKERLPDGDPRALRAFEAEAGLPLLKASKCPDFVLDRGHWFAEGLSDDEKVQLKAFLKTL